MPAPAVELRFHGAAGEVTGSCCEVAVGGTRFLVDCGMVQGDRDADGRNRTALDFVRDRPPAFVVLTHAHIDHSGLLPRLAALGWSGPVYATEPTAALLDVMLLDSAHIQEKDAQWARERAGRSGEGRRRAEPGPATEPLYGVAEATRALGLLVPRRYDEAFAPAPGVRVCLREAGHILGSSIAVIELGEGAGARRLAFSGDLGQPGRPVMRDPARIDAADVLVVESTYGNRLHKSLAETYDELAAVLGTTLPRGNVVVPAFAVGRTQELLHVFADLAQQGRVPPLRVFVDSPLAEAATRIHARYAASLDRETRDLVAWQAAHPERMQVRFTESVEDSVALNAIRAGAVILAASGMCEAGRVRHHLRHNLPHANAAVVFTGFQARGTLGRALVDGARSVRLFREDVPVRASVHTIGGLSAHADQRALLDWLKGFARAPARTFVVHGEAETSALFAGLVREQLGWSGVEVPGRDQPVAVG